MVEKLLRACSDIDRVYVLIRRKRGKTIAERLRELMDAKVSAPSPA